MGFRKEPEEEQRYFRNLSSRVVSRYDGAYSGLFERPRFWKTFCRGQRDLGAQKFKSVQVKLGCLGGGEISRKNRVMDRL